MFGWMKKKNTPAESTTPDDDHISDPIIASLLLDSTVFDLGAAQKAVTAGKIGGIAATELKIDKGVLVFTLRQEMIFIAPMGVPYPWSDLEGPCQTSWMWPDEHPAIELKHHKSHVLVTGVSGVADPLARRVLMTRLVGRLANLPGVLGIYWPEATLVHYPPVFAEMAETASVAEPPLLLWVDYRVIQEDDGSFTCFTTGLAPLGLMEMEIIALAMPPGELREWAMNITGYLLDRGGPIPHGDTVGATDEEKLLVTHTESRFGDRGLVMRIEAAD